MISSELPEVLGMSDRILVMRAGRIVAEVDRADATQARIAAAMMSDARAGRGGGGVSGMAIDDATRRLLRAPVACRAPRACLERGCFRRSARSSSCWSSPSSSLFVVVGAINPRFVAERT